MMSTIVLSEMCGDGSIPVGSYGKSNQPAARGEPGDSREMQRSFPARDTRRESVARQLDYCRLARKAHDEKNKKLTTSMLELGLPGRFEYRHPRRGIRILPGAATHHLAQ